MAIQTISEPKEYEVLAGFNVTSGDGEKRWEIGEPLASADVAESVIEALIEMDAIKEI